MAPLAHYRTVLCGFPSTGAGFASDHPPSYSAPICKLAGQDQSTSCKHNTALIPEIHWIHVTLGARPVNS